MKHLRLIYLVFTLKQFCVTLRGNTFVTLTCTKISCSRFCGRLHFERNLNTHKFQTTNAASNYGWHCLNFRTSRTSVLALAFPNCSLALLVMYHTQLMRTKPMLSLLNSKFDRNYFMFNFRCYLPDCEKCGGPGAELSPQGHQHAGADIQ